jgi:hypothetical protein
MSIGLLLIFNTLSMSCTGRTGYDIKPYCEILNPAPDTYTLEKTDEPTNDRNQIPFLRLHR